MCYPPNHNRLKKHVFVFSLQCCALFRFPLNLLGEAICVLILKNNIKKHGALPGMLGPCLFLELWMKGLGTCWRKWSGMTPVSPEHLVNRILFFVGCTCWPKMCFCIQEWGKYSCYTNLLYLVIPPFLGEQKKNSAQRLGTFLWKGQANRPTFTRHRIFTQEV